MTMNVPYDQWRWNVIDITFKFLKENNVKTIRQKDPDGSFHRYPLNKKHLGRIADCAFIAAKLNPHWGNCQEEVAINIIGACWVESQFDEGCINIENRFGTMDAGPMQTNSCNWNTPTGNGVCGWEIFCSQQHLNPKKLAQLFDLKTSMMFAAWLNEIFIKNGQRTYSFGKKNNDLIFHQRLMEIVVPPVLVENKI